MLGRGRKGGGRGDALYTSGLRRAVLGLVLGVVDVAAGRAGVLDGPVVGGAGEALGLLERELGDLGVLRVLGVGELEEHSQGDEGGLDGLDGGPAVSEDVEADGALGENGESRR